jgi:hypothetical protein
LLSLGKQALQRALQADQSHIRIRKSIAEKGFLAFSSINIKLFSILTLSLFPHHPSLKWLGGDLGYYLGAGLNAKITVRR